MSNHPQGVGTGQLIARSVQKWGIQNCSACHAPGVYQSHDSIRHGLTLDQAMAEVARQELSPDNVWLFVKGWKGCWVPKGDPREGQRVGDTCPCCGAERPPDVDLGLDVERFD